jgi:hypothetical protein
MLRHAFVVGGCGQFGSDQLEFLGQKRKFLVLLSADLGSNPLDSSKDLIEGGEMR